LHFKKTKSHALLLEHTSQKLAAHTAAPDDYQGCDAVLGGGNQCAVAEHAA
jgi:hypothetical protein